MKEALKKLLAASEAYASAAHAHHEASVFDDDEEMDKANQAGEAAYTKLQEAWKLAREALA